jgi:hypothetical protein
MGLEIDQSGKIEQTEKDTVLCLSNDKWYAICIPRNVKRKLQLFFRSNRQIRNFIILTHVAGLFILLQKVKPGKKVYVDEEYGDKKAIIHKLMQEMSDKKMFQPVIEFKLIGKNSRADYFAGLIAQKLLKPTWILGFEEILEEIKKTEVGKRLKNA